MSFIWISMLNLVLSQAVYPKGDESKPFKNSIQIRLPVYPMFELYNFVSQQNQINLNNKIRFTPWQIGYSNMPKRNRQWAFHFTHYYPFWFYKSRSNEFFLDAEHRWIFRSNKKWQWFAGAYVPCGFLYPQFLSNGNKLERPGLLLGAGFSGGLKYNFGRFNVTYGPRIALVKPINHVGIWNMYRWAIHISPLFQLGYSF